MTAPFFIGIDIGTQGARVVLIDAKGNMVAQNEEVFPLSNQSTEEQSPSLWIESCFRSLKKIVTDSKELIDLHDIKAMSVTSTSGTVIPIDENNEPLHNAIMYSDKRSATEGLLCRELAIKANSGYTGFNSSSGLSKMVWFVNNFPDKIRRIKKWIHATDYIIGSLSGRWGISDYTNVLKSGYDVKNLCWPSFIYEQLPLEKEWLCEVVAPGTPLGRLDAATAKELGLPFTIVVVAGMTDGCASQIASGAVNVGDWNTTIGTTLVVKGITTVELKDTGDTLYNHRHPEGYWMPGGAGNIGADWISEDFKEDLARLNQEASQLIPTGQFAYPLRQQGERFPFNAPNAKGFQPSGVNGAKLFAANMEGVAYIERYAYEVISRLAGEQVKAVYTAGGASNSDTWLTIRSNVLNLPIYKMKFVTGAVGAAILAASKTHFSSIIEATKALTQIEKEILPQQELAKKYDALYHQFIELLQQKGFITKEQ